MANIVFKDGNGDTKYNASTGAGTNGDPYICIVEPVQATHDDLNCNANIQVANADVANGNPVPVSDAGGTLTVDVGTALPAGTNNIGDVDVATIAAGETHIGQVGGHGIIVDLIPVLDTNIYADGDVLFDTAEVASAVRVNAGLGYLTSLCVIDKDDVGGDFDLFFFSANAPLGTQNAAPNISDANAANYLGHVSIIAANFYDLGGVKVAFKKRSELDFLVKGSTTSIWVAGIARAASTYTAAGLVLRFGIDQKN